MTVERSVPTTQRNVWDLLGGLEARLKEERRKALLPYSKAAIVEAQLASTPCSSCERLVEAEAGAEYRRGRIRGLEIALEILTASETGNVVDLYAG